MPIGVMMNNTLKQLVLSTFLLASLPSQAASVANINLNSELNTDSDNISLSKTSHYEPQMRMWELIDKSDFTYKVDSAHVFTTPTSNTVMFIETRTRIADSECESYKRAFDTYVKERLGSKDTITYTTESNGSGIADTKLKNTYSSTCFKERIDEAGYKYPAEFLGNFTSSSSWETYTREKDRLITGSPN